MPLIEQLISSGVLKSRALITAFKAIRRQDFLPPEAKRYAERDQAMPIGYGQTNSQPYTVAFMLELLSPRPGDKALDVGSGSGWTTALLACLVGREGRVYGIERLPELVAFSISNVGKYDFLRSGQVVIKVGDGYRGLASQAPFDRILVSAATPEVPPALLKQLKVGGRLVVPIGDAGGQDIVLIKKLGDAEFKSESHPGFVFVPLVKP